MAIRFRKSFKVAPGVRVNLGKKGASVSVGTKGLRYSVHSSGRRRKSAGIPGSGLYYTETTSGKSRKTNARKNRTEWTKLEQEQHKLAAQGDAHIQVEMYENHVKQMRSIHHECDDPVDWEEVFHRNPPFEKGESGPNEREANKKVISFQPGFFDRLLKRSEAKLAQLEAEVTKARQQDRELWEDWWRMHEIARRVLEKDIDAYFEVLDDFRPLDDLVEFGSGFEFGTDDADELHVSFDVNAKEVIPETSLSLTKTGRLSEKKLTKTAYYDLYQDYVCSCALRIARDLFALLPVGKVYVHAYEEDLNTATGHLEKGAILSVKYERAVLEKLHFIKLDPSDALENFEHRMNFKKTKGFEIVEELRS